MYSLRGYFLVSFFLPSAKNNNMQRKRRAQQSLWTVRYLFYFFYLYPIYALITRDRGFESCFDYATDTRLHCE